MTRAGVETLDFGALLAGIEALDGAGLDPALAAELWRTGARFADRRLLAALPSFTQYQNDDLASEVGACAGGGAYPAFSVTGPTCALQCAHCKGRILEPMIAVRDGAHLERLVRDMQARQGLRGFLLSGGSNRANEVPLVRVLPAVARLKRDLPHLEIAAHTGLVDRARAEALAGAGIDVAMLDIIGAEATIREVYNLDRTPDDFARALAALVGAGLAVVPHVVIGLHFGQLFGEHRALEMIARHPTAAAILVVVMPQFATPGTFRPVALADAARVFALARETLADRKLLLGCARPAGLWRRAADACAVLAGLDGIAHPADSVVPLAHALGRRLTASGACCGVDGCRVDARGVAASRGGADARVGAV